MAWLDDLLGKTILLSGTPLTDRKMLNFIPAAGLSLSVVDNPATSVNGYVGSTDVTIGTGTGISGSGAVLLTTADNGKTLINTASVVWDLPTAALGLSFRVINAVAGGTTLQANGTDTIGSLGLVSSAGGTFVCTDTLAGGILVGYAGGWALLGMSGGWSKT